MECSTKFERCGTNWTFKLEQFLGVASISDGNKNHCALSNQKATDIKNWKKQSSSKKKDLLVEISNIDVNVLAQKQNSIEVDVIDWVESSSS